MLYELQPVSIRQLLTFSRATWSQIVMGWLGIVVLLVADLCFLRYQSACILLGDSGDILAAGTLSLSFAPSLFTSFDLLVSGVSDICLQTFSNFRIFGALLPLLSSEATVMQQVLDDDDDSLWSHSPPRELTPPARRFRYLSVLYGLLFRV
jgi:hypothetical protein